MSFGNVSYYILKFSLQLVVRIIIYYCYYEKVVCCIIMLIIYKFIVGILCRNTKEDEADMIINNCRKINIVVCILYPFHNVISKGCSISDAIENIDIGKSYNLNRIIFNNYY